MIRLLIIMDYLQSPPIYKVNLIMPRDARNAHDLSIPNIYYRRWILFNIFEDQSSNW